MDWKNVAILTSLLFIGVDFLQSWGTFPSSIFHVDHGFHLLKFELFSKYGLANYAETGGVNWELLIPPTLLPFLLLSKLLYPKLAYFLSYYLIIAVAYVMAKKIVPGKEKNVLLALLFPLSVFAFFRVGRMLELIAHVPFLILFSYLGKKSNWKVTAALFTLGVVSHIPTTIFYYPALALKAWSKGLKKQLVSWLAIAGLWVSWYVPKTFGMSIWKMSRVEFLSGIKQTISVMGIGGLLYASIIMMVAGLLVSLKFKEGKYAFFSFFMTIGVVFIAMLSPQLLKFIPLWNQIVISTLLPLYAYMLLETKLYRIAFLALFVVVIIPLPWTDFTPQDKAVLNQINGSHITTASLLKGARNRLSIQNYLAHRGTKSLTALTWEFSDPELFLFNPNKCEDLNVGAEYVILPSKETWAKLCGPFFESEQLLAVKVL